MTPLARRARLTHTLTLVSMLALLILFAVQFLAFNPSINGVIITALHGLPLLAFLPGILRHGPKVYIWLCFVILVYFCQGVMNSFALPSPAGILGLLEALLATVLFCSSMYAARFHSQLGRAESGAATGDA